MNTAHNIPPRPDPLQPVAAGTIRSWLDGILAPDQWVEVRAFDIDGQEKTKRCRLFGPHERANLVAFALELSGRASGVYFTLNPVKSETLGSAGQKDIERRRLLLIDCDPNRDELAAAEARAAGQGGKLSATDAEKAQATARAQEVRDYLASLGWPSPVEADSGNGAHLLYLIDLPNDAASTKLVKAVLVELAHRFDDADVEIDRVVSDAPRITKLYGTAARKGTATEERPHRYARVVSIPPTWSSEPVTRQQLQALTRPDPAPAVVPFIPPTSKATRGDDGRWTPEARAVAYLQACQPALSGSKGHNQTFKVACKVGPGFDLSPDTAFRLIWEVYNPTCDPPWSEQEIRHKLEDAYADESHRLGWLRDEPRKGAVSRGAAPGPSSTRPKPGSGQVAPPKPPGEIPGPPDAPIPDLPNEAPDDPHRLARIFLEQCCTHPDGWTLVFHNGEFHRWDGAYRPVPDKVVRAEVNKAAKVEIDRVNLVAVASHKRQGSDKPPPVAKKVSAALVNNVHQALSGYALLPSKVEAPAWLCEGAPWPAAEVLPVRNGLVHLPSFANGKAALIPPTPTFFCPYATDYDFDPKATTPETWFGFLRQLWPDDPQSVSTLQEWFGYHLTPDVSQQKIGMIIGPKRSGKGTIVRILSAMMGAMNVCNPTLSGLGTQFGQAILIGKLAAIITDARITGRSDIAQIVETLLSISGEDSKTISRKHIDDWSGKLACKFSIISNETPRLADSSGALAGRMIMFRLTRSFYGQEDHGLFGKLIPEMPGILVWAIQGWKRLNERGHFIQPESGSPLVTEMEELSSPHGSFVRDCCDLDRPDLEVDCETLFEAWRAWCKRINRLNDGDLPQFGKDLRSVAPHIETKPYRKGTPPNQVWSRKFVGIDLKPPTF